MTFRDLVVNKDLTSYRLAKITGIPQTTISDLYTGKREFSSMRLKNAIAIAEALDMSVYDMLDRLQTKSSFELYKSNMCHELRSKGDKRFVYDVLKSGKIQTLFDDGQKLQALYLLALTDYVSRENNIPLCKEYHELRTYCYEKPIFPSGVVIASLTTNGEAKEDALKNCIPEFKRHNIIESDIRNVR